MKICSIENCEKVHYAKSWCRNHYRSLSGEYKRQWLREGKRRALYKKNWWKKNPGRYREYRKIYYSGYYEKYKNEIIENVKKWKEKQPIEKKRQWYKKDNYRRHFGNNREKRFKGMERSVLDVGLLDWNIDRNIMLT